MNYLIESLKKVRKRSILLLLSLSLSMLLLVFRIFYSGSSSFIFLGWNLFLAWVPYFISRIAIKFKKLQQSFVIFPLLFIWLLFFPNSIYILTDIIHLQNSQNMPFWYALILILSFSFTGILFGFISLWDFQEYIKNKYNINYSWLFCIISITSGSFGVYIGRYLRWNSWDIFINPRDIASDIYNIIIEPHNNMAVYGMTIFLSCLIFIAYLSFFYINNKTGKI